MAVLTFPEELPGVSVTGSPEEIAELVIAIQEDPVFRGPVIQDSEGTKIVGQLNLRPYSQREAIVRLQQILPCPFSTSEVMRLLFRYNQGCDSTPSGPLGRLVRDGILVRLSPGLYCFSQDPRAIKQGLIKPGTTDDHRSNAPGLNSQEVTPSPEGD